MVAIQVVNHAGLSHSLARRVERAIVIQVDRDVRSVWPVQRVRFARVGERLELRAGCPDVLEVGWHSPGRIVAYAGCRGFPASFVMSHEVIESLVDPLGTGREVCDATIPFRYRVRGMVVADFVRPRYYGRRPGATDFLRRMWVRAPFYGAIIHVQTLGSERGIESGTG